MCEICSELTIKTSQRRHGFHLLLFFIVGFEGIPEFLDSGRKSWTLDSGRWTLDSRRWTLDAGLWTLCSGLWTLDARRWTVDAECYTVDVKTLKCKTVQSFENNETISMTSFFQATLSSHLKKPKVFRWFGERKSARLFTEVANHFFNGFRLLELGGNNTTFLSPINGPSKKRTPLASLPFSFLRRNSGQTLIKNFLKSGQVISGHSV